MQIDLNQLLNAAVAVLTFPMLFQGAVVAYVWGAADVTLLMVAKRLFLLLPAMAVIFALWMSIGCLLTVIFRKNRREFINALFITWWDLGKSIVAFWGGIFHFVIHLGITLFEFAKIIIVGVWTVLLELLLVPLRFLSNMGQRVMNSNVPWLAVILTLTWCIIETVIFTYVMTPLVLDTFSNLTGETFSEYAIRIPLGIFLFFIALGSYAVLSNFVTAVKSKNVGAIIGVTIIELVVMGVEVLFLYREFVDSLVPWLAQYSSNFELGVFGILSIAAFVWFGIRSVSWFLFAADGTPTILAIIKGKGVELDRSEYEHRPVKTKTSTTLIDQVKADMAWFKHRGQELLGSFMLPGLQIIAASINFCTLLISGAHLFKLPFKNFQEILDSTMLLQRASSQNHQPQRPVKMQNRYEPSGQKAYSR